MRDVDTTPCFPYTLCMSPFELWVIKKKNTNNPGWHSRVSFQELHTRCIFYRTCTMSEVNRDTCMSELPQTSKCLIPFHVLCWGATRATLNSWLVLLKLSHDWWIGGKSIAHVAILANYSLRDNIKRWAQCVSVCLAFTVINGYRKYRPLWRYCYGFVGNLFDARVDFKCWTPLLSLW